MQLYFIRHAQSTVNAFLACGEQCKARSIVDPDLSEAGRQQALRLAEYLAEPRARMVASGEDAQNRVGFGLTHIYCSLMLRAVMTGDVVATRLGLPLLGWIDLHEEGGLFLATDTSEYLGQPGFGRRYFVSAYPTMLLPEHLQDGGWWNRGVELAAEASARAQRVADDLRRRHGGTDDRVALVSHLGFYSYLVSVLLGLDQLSTAACFINNASISRLSIDESDTHVIYENRCDHLPCELLTI
jgi:2,3-bisphosphoglycerate-dependent phosphoglycerate mutase